MSLTIHHNDPLGKAFRANEIVKGYVQLDSKQQDVSEALVSIDFAGRCEATILHATSYDGSYSYNDGRHRWYFKFKFPQRADPGYVRSPRGEGDYLRYDTLYRGNTGFTNLYGHSLPSSFEAHNVVSIRYYLKARFEPAEGSKGALTQSLVAIEDIPFIQRTPQSGDPFVEPGQISDVEELFPRVNPFRKEYKVRSFSLLSPAINREHSLVDKWKTKFNPSSLPGVKLRIEITFPHCVYQNCEYVLPCNVGVYIQPFLQDPNCEYNNTNIYLNQVFMSRIKIELHRTVSIRAHDRNVDHTEIFTLYNNPNGLEIEVDYSDVGRATGFRRRAVPPTSLNQPDLDARLELQICLPQGISETVSTYNIAVQYRVVATMTMKVGEEALECTPMDEDAYQVLPFIKDVPPILPW